MFLALLVVLLLAEAYRRSRHRLHALMPAMPDAWRALRADARAALARVATWEWIGLTIVTMLALALRARELSQPIRYDEAATWLDYASQPLARALSDYRFPNNHLFHTLLVHISAALFGAAPWALRLPAFLAGIALVPLTWALTRALYAREAALGAAGLAAASASLVLYSTNARGYTIVACLTVMLALLATRQLRADNLAGWAALAAIAALGAWTIPTMLYPAGGIGLWLWLEARADDAAIDAKTMRARLRWTGLAALCLTVVLYLPVVARSGIALVVGNRFVRPQSRSEFFAQLPAFLRDVGADFTRGWGPLLAALLAVGMIAAIVASKRIARHRVPMLVPVLAWSLVLLVVNGRLPYIRVWMFVLPFVLATAAAGIEWLTQRAFVRTTPRVSRLATLTVQGVIAAVATVALIRSDVVRLADDTGTLRDGRAIADFLARNVQSRDRVIASAPSDLPLAYHLRARIGNADPLRATPDSAQQLWVVVNTTTGQSERQLVDAAEIVTADFGAPVVARRFPEATVYLRRRQHPGCVLDPSLCR
jgi:hypothetical protein